MPQSVSTYFENRFDGLAYHYYIQPYVIEPEHTNILWFSNSPQYSLYIQAYYGLVTRRNIHWTLIDSLAKIVKQHNPG